MARPPNRRNSSSEDDEDNQNPTTSEDAVIPQSITTIGIDFGSLRSSMDNLGGSFRTLSDEFARMLINSVVERSTTRSAFRGIPRLGEIAPPNYKKRQKANRVQFLEHTTDISLQSITEANPNKLRGYCKMLNVSVDYKKFIEGGAYHDELRTACKDAMGYPNLVGSSSIRMGHGYLKDWYIVRSGVKLIMDTQRIPSLMEALGRFMINLSGRRTSHISTEVSIQRNIERRHYEIRMCVKVPEEALENASSMNFNAEHVLVQIMQQQTEQNQTMTAIMRRMVTLFDEYSKTKQYVSFKEWVKELHPEDVPLIKRVLDNNCNYSDDFGFDVDTQDAQRFLKLLGQGNKKQSVTSKGRRIKLSRKTKKDPD